MQKPLLVLCSFFCMAVLLFAGCRDTQLVSIAWADEHSIARSKDQQPIVELNSARQDHCLAETAPQHQATQLRRDGRWLIDNHGRVVLLHGVNAVWKTAPYVPPDNAAGFIAEDADWLQRYGFNSARIGVLFPGVMPQRGQVDQQYLQQWDRIVQLLASRKIWMLFDFHQDMYSEAFQGEGFPDWAVYDYFPAYNTANRGFPGNYLTHPVQQQFDQLYENKDDIWADFGHAWQAVADQWKSQPYHLGYDLMNEPWPGSDWLACTNPLSGCPNQDARLQTFFDHIRADIRRVDARNLVWYEPFLTFDFGTPNAFGVNQPIADTQIGFSYHSYCLTGAALNMAGLSGLPGCAWQHKRVAEYADETIEVMQATSLMTEFGANQDLSDMRQATRIADEHLVGWQYWHYKNWQDPTTQSQGKGAQSLFEQDGDLSTARMDKLRILSRAYPQYTAGIPVKLRFDVDSGHMDYRYTPRRTTAATEIYVPVEVHYPNGYKVIAEGVESINITADNHRLIVHEQPGSCEARIQIIALQAADK